MWTASFSLRETSSAGRISATRCVSSLVWQLPRVSAPLYPQEQLAAQIAERERQRQAERRQREAEEREAEERVRMDLEAMNRRKERERERRQQKEVRV